MKSFLLLTTSISMLLSCTERQDSGLLSGSFNPRGVFVVGTWGRDGKDGGIDRVLIPRLRNELAPLGIPPENIYSQAWSRRYNTDSLPGDVPDTAKHVDTLRVKMQNNGIVKASYIALIGHSFGGWASARISTSFGKADAVFLLDPVVMMGYRDRDRERIVNAAYGKSFYQDRSVIDIDPCISGGVIDAASAGLLRCDINASISCGQKFQGLSEGNEKISFAREPDGAFKKVNCTLMGRKKIPISHTSIDDDGYLQQLIFDKIVGDVKNRMFSTPMSQQFLWQEMPGLASDVGVYDQDSIAVLGAEGTDKIIYRWNSSDWIHVPGYATAIDTGPDGSLWVVNSNGSIYRDAGKGFVKLPGQATDIAVGADGSAWVVGSGGGIYRWNGSDWDKIPGLAKRISVGPDGNAVVVNPDGEIYRFNGSHFFKLPGLASDVGVGADASIWIIGVDTNPHGFGIYRWFNNAWQKIEGGGVAIDVDNRGQAWVVNNVGGIYKASRL